MSEAPAGASNDEKCLTCNLPLDLPRPALVVEAPSVYHTRGLLVHSSESDEVIIPHLDPGIVPGVLRSSPSLVSIINRTSHYNRSTSELSQSTGKLRCHCRVHDSIATLVVMLFSRVPRGRWLSKEMRSVIALHHRELSTTEAHSHVISHTLSDGATIINREPCREVKCPLSGYLCCK
ncbi:hypothetical protein IGI04_030799 [Brassica rapa subsp. trilocularis]|uniref:Uncharacterized protein n=1 Tax=Brassica rapa subsp. trilocularis TaxID=1813537 RepID=A0ABQ7LRS8_BRACM|nr:hypothetical protein IGI04_030799 [Brassica rapa subsp. trilocularis]